MTALLLYSPYTNSDLLLRGNPSLATRNQIQQSAAYLGCGKPDLLVVQ